MVKKRKCLLTGDASDTIFRTVGKWGRRRRCWRPFSVPCPPDRPGRGALTRHGRRRPTIHEFLRRRKRKTNRGWSACADHDETGSPPRARSAFADGNADRRVESANVDIPARHLRGANVDPVAICLPDAYVDGRRRIGTRIAARPYAPPSPPSCPDLFRASTWFRRLARARPAPRCRKTWMPGTSPGMTVGETAARRRARLSPRPVVTPALSRGPAPQAPPSPGFPRMGSGTSLDPDGVDAPSDGIGVPQWRCL